MKKPSRRTKCPPLSTVTVTLVAPGTLFTPTDDPRCPTCNGTWTPKYYEFMEKGRRYHGYDCGLCGSLLQTG